MKTWMKLVFCAAVAALWSVNAACAAEAAGTVKTLKGEVSIVRDGANIKAAKGMKLMAADTIITGSRSSVGITLMDATLLSFGPDSSSQLSKFSYDPVKRDGNLLISMIKGSMRFVTGLLGKHNPAAVAIRLPSSATLGIRGTDFIVSVEGGE